MKEYISKIKKSNISNTDKNYLLSLAFQINNDFDDELSLLQNLHQDEFNDYFAERLNWHNASNHEKYEKRPALYAERSPDFDTAILNKLCFVSGCDANYYQMLIECIESIKNTVIYKYIPFFVLDCGLTDDQKLALSKIDTKIIDPGWDIKIGRMSKPCYKAMTARPFLNKHFPGYRYYFWMDADTWVQDETSLDRYINLCLKQGIGICQNTDPTFFTESIDQCRLADVVDETLFTPELWQNTYSICVGNFCIDADSDIFENWQKIMLKNVQAKGFNFFSEQTSLNLVIANANVLEKHDNFSVCSRCALLHTDSDHVLYEDETNKRIGIVHLISNAKKRGFNEVLPKIDTAITDPHQLKLYRHYLNRINTYKGYKKLYMPGLVRACTRFRTYPWRNKDALKERFNKKFSEISKNL